MNLFIKIIRFKHKVLLLLFVCVIGCFSININAKNKVLKLSGQEIINNNYVVKNSTEFLEALSKAKSGETIVVSKGTYSFTEPIKIKNSGALESVITITFKKGDSRPIFDFTSMEENSSNKGIQLNGSFWHIKGLKIIGAGDNGMLVKGSNNKIEFCDFTECSDSGLQLGSGASNNTILNCDSFFNADSSLENADGFACKLDVGTGNKFVGCRAWNNLDDGWDGYLRGTDSITTSYNNCWAIKNGYLKDGTKGDGDGNGFKTGGSDDKLLKHNAIYSNCIVAGNINDGFDHNSNRGIVEIYNSVAYDNGRNFAFSDKNSLAKIILKNNVTIGDYGKAKATIIDSSNNSWQEGFLATESDFKSLDYSELIADRKLDGSLPDVIFFHLKSDSKLIDKGIDVGLPYNGSAPDLGTFEYK